VKLTHKPNGHVQTNSVSERELYLQHQQVIQRAQEVQAQEQQAAGQQQHVNLLQQQYHNQNQQAGVQGQQQPSLAQMAQYQGQQASQQQQQVQRYQAMYQQDLSSQLVQQPICTAAAQSGLYRYNPQLAPIQTQHQYPALGGSPTHYMTSQQSQGQSVPQSPLYGGQTAHSPTMLYSTGLSGVGGVAGHGQPVQLPHPPQQVVSGQYYSPTNYALVNGMQHQQVSY
jgi:hypothetical protein